ncbi:MAG: 50S ribosomal protein L11 methyltransferase [Xanthomonadales bacterium]|nr:50S ribosomal protein L11 methyltransferase [Xanthomonadales bacterium]
MPWTEVSIALTREQVEEAEGVLEALGALAITLEDRSDQPVLEPAPGATPLWPAVRLRGLFDTDVDRQAVLRALQDMSGTGHSERIRWRQVGDRDWERAWMDRFHPMCFGKYLWIVPTGMAIPHDPRNVQIRLDPGLAFGSGTHPTTALCLEWIDGHDMNGLRVVDYGCGSGILGIAACLEGASRAECVDNDPQALEATARNADRNGVGDRVICLSPKAFWPADSDLVLANILAGPLIALAPVIAGAVRPGGHVVLSGLLEEQGDEVTTAYLPWCKRPRSESREGWLRLELRRSAGPTTVT